ncbi:MAG: ribosome hibernation-promoting factor, HPF/YfiA family, partial [Parahaliea sp.]
MQLNVSGHHVDVTTALREYVESKFERLQRHFDHITNTDVTL